MNNIIEREELNNSVNVRVMQEEDYSCLDEFLYQAIFIPEGETLSHRDIIKIPEIFIYIKDFGKQKGDMGVVAEKNGGIIGAAWVRIISAYGHIDREIPELAISILPKERGQGVGTHLMEKLFVLLKDNGFKQTSLSVQKNNPASKFYQRLGYKITEEKVNFANHEDYIMIKTL